jgi:hypothetical protein
VATKRTKVPFDWTQNDKGRVNSSPVFVELCAEVSRLIRNEAHTLITGDTFSVARLILAQLAHRHGLAPYGARSSASLDGAAGKGTS